MNGSVALVRSDRGAGVKPGPPTPKRGRTNLAEAVHREERPVGISGQAPNDSPEFAESLAAIGTRLSPSEP